MKNNESKTTNKAEAVIEAIEEQRKNDLEFAVEEVCSMASNIHFAFRTYSKDGCGNTNATAREI